jgi:hypothetical protein
MLAVAVRPIRSSMHDSEREHTDDEETRERAARPAPPGRGLEQFVSHVGNRAFGELRSRGVVVNSAGVPRIARQDEEEEDPGLDESQKARLTAMAIGPIRGAAARLGTGERSEVRSVIRHLTPVQGVLNAFVARGETKQTLTTASEEVAGVVTVLRSLDLTHRQVIFLTRSDWQTAKRHLAATRAELRRAAHPPRGQTPLPPDDVRDLEEGQAHIQALSQQIDATLRDLLEAPKTQEGFQRVVDTGVQVLDQFESFTVEGGQIPASFTRAKTAFRDGLLRMMPIVMGREEAVREAQSSLQSTANNLAALSGAEVIEPPEEEPAEAPPPEPAPSPNPLPPPQPVPTP